MAFCVHVAALIAALQTLIIGGVVEGLKCNVCFNTSSWEDCTKRSELVTCSQMQVENMHRRLNLMDPNMQLNVKSLMPLEFQCFQLQLKRFNHNELTFASGCSYRQVDICSSKLVASEIVYCQRCSTADGCSHSRLSTRSKRDTSDPLECPLCISNSSWADCNAHAGPADCSEQLVNESHSRLSEFNPSLGLVPAGSRTFQCATLKLEVLVDSNKMFLKTCTYAQSNFCDSWTNDASVIDCAICSTGQPSANCNEWEGPLTTTVSSASSTLSTASGTQQDSTTVSGVATETTETSPAQSSSTSVPPAPPTNDPNRYAPQPQGIVYLLGVVSGLVVLLALAIIISVIRRYLKKRR